MTSSANRATMMVETLMCLVCGKTGWITVPVAGYEAWKKGAFIQNALPMLDQGEREQLITGLHPQCFEMAFPPED